MTATATTAMARTMTEQQQAQHAGTGILAIGEVSYVEVPAVGHKENTTEKKRLVTASKATAETTITTMDMMNSFMRRQQARHEAARKLLNDKMNNVQGLVVVPNKKTVGRKNNTCDVEVHEADRRFAFGVVSDVEVPGVSLNDKTNNVDVPVVVLKKKTVGRKKNIFDVELPGVGLKNNIYGVEVPSVGMSNNM